MIFLSIGLPGCFAEWCDAMTARLAGSALGAIEVIGANTLEDLARCVIRTGASHFVVGSRQPESRLRAALAEGKGRFVLALDDPRAAVADMMMQHGYDLTSATRAVASSVATLLRCPDLPGALVLRMGRGPPDAGAVARSIAAHFGLAATAAEIEAMVDGLREAGIALAPRDTGAWWDRLGDDERRLVEGALGGYGDYFATGSLGRLTWGREFFFIGDPPNDAATRGIDVTGRARCLLYGPYIAIPPGSWTAHVVLGCSQETDGASFVIEICAGTPLSRTTFRPNGGGIFEASLEFVVEEANDGALEVRIFNERPIFDGRMGLGKVILTPQARARTAGDDELALALGLKTSRPSPVPGSQTIA